MRERKGSADVVFKCLFHAIGRVSNYCFFFLPWLCKMSLTLTNTQKKSAQRAARKKVCVCVCVCVCFFFYSSSPFSPCSLTCLRRIFFLSFFYFWSFFFFSLTSFTPLRSVCLVYQSLVAFLCCSVCVSKRDGQMKFLIYNKLTYLLPKKQGKNATLHLIQSKHPFLLHFFFSFLFP